MSRQLSADEKKPEVVTVKKGRTHVHAGVLYDGDASEKERRQFTCRAMQAKRLRAAGVVE